MGKITSPIMLTCVFLLFLVGCSQREIKELSESLKDTSKDLKEDYLRRCEQTPINCDPKIIEEYKKDLLEEKKQIEQNKEIKILSEEEIESKLKRCDGYKKAEYESFDDTRQGYIENCYIEIAEENNAPNVCSKIDTGYLQKDCYLHFGTKFLDITYCYKINENFSQEECIEELNKKIKINKEIEETKKQINVSVKTIIKIGTAPQNAINICNSIETDFQGKRWKERCLTKLGIKHGDVSLCKVAAQRLYLPYEERYANICNVVLNRDKSKCDNSNCLSESAFYLNDISFCDSISNEDILYKKACIALLSKNSDLCASFFIDPENGVDVLGVFCIRNLAKMEKNANLCNKIITKGISGKEKCLKDAAIAMKDISVIKKDSLKELYNSDDSLNSMVESLNGWYNAVVEKDTSKCKKMSQLAPVGDNGRIEFAMECYTDIALSMES